MPQRRTFAVPAIGRRRRPHLGVVVAAILAVGMAMEGAAQTVDVRQWQGQAAITRQPEQVLARTQAEWRSLWSRVGMPPPDLFEPGRTNAVGIFLGPRAAGHAVNLISASRRRDRLVVVFEERIPPGAGGALAARQPVPPPAPAPARPVASAPIPSGGASFAGNGAALTAPSVASRTGPAPASSPWAIILINRTDLPISVEQRLYR